MSNFDTNIKEVDTESHNMNQLLLFSCQKEARNQVGKYCCYIGIPEDYKENHIKVHRLLFDWRKGWDIQLSMCHLKKDIPQRRKDIHKGGWILSGMMQEELDN